MRVLFVGANSAAKIRLVQIVDLIIKGETISKDKIKEIALSKSEEFFREHASNKLLACNITSRNNETELKNAINFLSTTENYDASMILLATSLLTNSQLELLISLSCSLTIKPIIYFLLTDIRHASLSVSSTSIRPTLHEWGRKQELDAKLLSKFDDQELFPFKKNEELKDTISSPLFEKLKLELKICAHGIHQDTKYFDRTSIPTSVPVSVVRQVCEENEQEKLETLVEEFITKASSVDCSDDGNNGDSNSDSNSVCEKYAELATQILVGERKINPGFCPKLEVYLGYARAITEYFLDSSRDLCTISREINKLCRAASKRAEDNEYLQSQIRLLQMTTDCMSSSFSTLQTMFHDNHSATLATIKDTTSLFSTTLEHLESVKKQQDLVRKQRKNSLLQFIKVTMQIVAIAGIGCSVYALFSAFQAGGVSAMTTKITEMVTKKVITTATSTVLSSTPLAPLAPLVSLVPVDSFVPGSDITDVPKIISDSTKLPDILPFTIPTSVTNPSVKCGISGYWEAIKEGFSKNDEFTKLGYDLAMINYNAPQLMEQTTREKSLLFAATVWTPRVMNGYGSLRQRISDCSKQ